VYKHKSPRFARNSRLISWIGKVVSTQEDSVVVNWYHGTRGGTYTLRQNYTDEVDIHTIICDMMLTARGQLYKNYQKQGVMLE